MQIVHRHPILRHRVAQLIGRTMARPPLDPRSGHPQRKGLNVVITTTPLRHRGPPELPTPDDQRVFQHPPRLQVLHQRGGGPVHVTGNRLNPLFHPTMVIPSPVIELDKAHPAFRQTTGQQAVRRKRSIPGLRAIAVEHLL